MKIIFKPNPGITIKNTTIQDIGKILDLQKETFPSMSKENSVWKQNHLESHINIFPEGQFCIDINGRIVGSSSSLIVSLKPEYADHTFSEITGKSTFSTHNRYGDSLYGADISIHPKFRRLGLATLLYNARRDLARTLNLRRIIAGGRLSNYCEYASRMSPQRYVQKVINKEIDDPVLNFQLKNGFKVIKILDNYIQDSRSLNHASFIEWINQDYKK